VPPDPDKYCGRVVSSDFRVLNTQNTGLSFPAEFDSAFTAQEKILEFMLLDPTTCGIIEPPPIPPIPPPSPGRLRSNRAIWLMKKYLSRLREKKATL